LNGNLDVSGTLGVTGVLTATSLDISGDIDVDGTTNLDVVDIDGAVDMASTLLVTGVLTTTAATVSNGGGQFNGAINVGVDDTGYDVKFFGATTGKSLLWDESADSLIVTGTTTLVGTTNLDAVDIDGATQIDATVTVGVDDTGYDVKFFGATAGAYMLWDESADDLILGGAAGLSVNSTALVTGVLTTTAATVSNGGGQFNGAINVGVDDTGYDVKFFGATAGAYMLWDESADDLILGGAAGLSVNSTALVTGVLTTTAATVFNGGFASNAASTIATTDNSVNLTLTSTDADDSGGPKMNFYRNSASPAAGDILTQIGHQGKNDAGETISYMYQNWRAAAVGDGAESGQFDINTYTAGTAYERLGIDPTETVFNQDHADLDFRVESDTKTHAFFVDGDNTSNRLKIGMGTGTISNPYSQNNFTDVNIDGVWGGVISFKVGGTETGFAGQRSSGNGGMAVGASSGHELHIISNGVLAQHIDTSGNIIIANTGGTLRTTTAGTSNFRAGVNAGNSIASGGNYNTVVGDEAGTAITTGDGMVAIGYQALMTEDTEGYSTAVGSGALKMQNTGSSAFNVAVGHEAGVAVSTGVQNTLVGTYAGHDLNTGSYNVAIGVNALSLGTSSGSTVAIGYTAGKTLATASNNTMIGSQAGEIRTGAGNTIVGQYAGRDGTDGTDNTFIGRNSGYTITTGSKNSILGMYNGNQDGLDIRTSSNNIVLSDGDGNPRVHIDGSGRNYVTANEVSYWSFAVSNENNTSGNGTYRSLLPSNCNNTSSYHLVANTSGGGDMLFIYGNGNVVNYNNSYGSISDVKLKENVVDSGSQWDDIKAIQVRKYSMKARQP
jgi:hypothetical protein